MPFLEARTYLDHLAAHKGGGQLTMGGQIRRGQENKKSSGREPVAGALGGWTGGTGRAQSVGLRGKNDP